ncbi:hypothetical protein F0562_022384 [Nyssa sinensis]|uniref:DUF4216 domain-containing protein n=1 Tax=Nyssa sinensis TaxID=561372 RepID=A0A5J5BNI6_9ASTE|nr:hypothetical protein F0562_022384 [Nyssa sinensis]
MNGFKFHTIQREKYRQTQNSGVVVTVYKGDKEIQYYGVLKDIIELSYCFDNKIFLFKCDSWDVGNKRTRIHTDSYCTSVNMARTRYTNDPYVLASQVKQVFYLKDARFRGNWYVVDLVKPRNIYDFLEVNEEDNGLVESDVFQEEEQSAYYEDLQRHRSFEAIDNENDSSAIGSSSRIRTDIEAFQVDTLQVRPLNGEAIGGPKITN